MSEHGWQKDVFDALCDADVRQIAFVPDAGHSYVIREAIASPDIHDVVLTTEEEGVGVVCGAWLGGQRGVLLMQSSGVGNCVNTFSLLEACRFFSADGPPRVLPPRDGVFVKNRFPAVLGLPTF